MPMPSVPRVRTVLLLAALALAGCTTERGGSVSLLNPATPAPAKPAKPAPPPIDMAGRWMLSSPGAGLCGMNFSGRANATEGKIAPEGGCPGNFFTSRGWELDAGSLVIKDHTGKALASLPQSDPPGRFEGVAAGGLPVTLTR
jgi:hypothetical protein